MLHDVIEIQK